MSHDLALELISPSSSHMLNQSMVLMVCLFMNKQNEAVDGILSSAEQLRA